MIQLLSILLSLVAIEMLLSVDNALVNATIAENLKEPQRSKAIRLGILLGAGFRVAFLFVAAFIIKNPWIKVLGGMYLVWLFIEHVGKEVTEEGKQIKSPTSYQRTIVEIALADIVFSLDNVISAVSFSDNTLYVVFGVLIGIISMLFITPILSKFIHAYKGLPTAAYCIVGLIGFLLVIETLFHVHIGEFEKFAVIFLIIAFTLWYEKNDKVRKVFKKPLIYGALLAGLPLDLIRIIKVIFSRKTKV